MEEITKPVLSISTSESGKNAYYLPSCSVVEHQPAYASCLDKIRQIKERSKNVSSFSECVSAVRNGVCKAADMRQEEELKGQAIYFVPRIAFERTEYDPTAPSWIDRPVNSSKPRRAQASVRALTPTAALGAGYADAINAAINSLPAVSAQPVHATATFAAIPRMPAPVMVAGETPMQFARRIAAITA